MVYMEDTFTDVAIFACPCEMLNQWFVYMEDFFFLTDIEICEVPDCVENTFTDMEISACPWKIPNGLYGR